jgi:hypothetical protein
MWLECVFVQYIMVHEHGRACTKENVRKRNFHKARAHVSESQLLRYWMHSEIVLELQQNNGHSEITLDSSNTVQQLHVIALQTC